jgi:hypothetical protein
MGSESSGGRGGRKEGRDVRLRVAVVVAFMVMALVPAYLAYDAGLLPGPPQASADAGDGRVSRVTSLAWPDEPLGLSASDTTLYWEQRDRSATIAGLWGYNVRADRVIRVLERPFAGKIAGRPAAARDIVVWAAWTGRRGDGVPRIEAYDTSSTRRWTAASAGRQPAAAGRTVVWVDRGDGARGGDVIRGLDSVTDDQYAIATGARVRQLAAHGSRVVWIAGRGDKAGVWLGSLRVRKLTRLAPSGTAVAVDPGRVVWAVAADGSSRLVCRDQRTGKTAPLCRVTGRVSSLTLSRDHAAWVTTPDAGSPKVWVYDFARREAFVLDGSGGRQTSPVIVAGSVYWADDRDGEWALYGKALRP